tara:strand:- start:157 stop:276 length:120 start_codon:yes stop_codon:yes gene_type:complete
VKKPKNKEKIKTTTLTTRWIPFLLSVSEAKNLSNAINIK